MPSGAIITQIAEEHAQLQLCITNCDRAVEDLNETNKLLETLERDIKEREQRLEELIEKRKTDYQDLDKLHRSSTRRFLARVKNGGREGLKHMLDMEEHRYVQAAQTEHDEALSISALRAVAENARQKKSDLESQIAIREEILQYLDRLYESAFDGPSPDFPEEDEIEQDMKDAEVNFEHAQADLNGEKTVAGMLNEASKCSSRALSILNNSVYSDSDMGPAYLILAKELTDQAQQLLDRARGLQPMVGQIKLESVVPTGTGHGRLSTGKKFLQKWMQRTKESLQVYHEDIIAECAASKERIKNLARAADEAQSFVMSTRNLLVATRRSILERVHEDGGVRVNSRREENDARSSQGMQGAEGAREVTGSSTGLPPPQDIPAVPSEDPPSYDSQSTFSFPFPG